MSTPATREHRRNQMRELRQAGAKQQEIAVALGVSRSLVQKELSRMELPLPAPIPDTSKRFQTNRGAATHTVRLAEKAPQGGRHTGGMFMDHGIRYIMPPEDELGGWTSFDLGADSWRGMDMADTLRVLKRISPDVSLAIWNYLRTGDAGHEAKAYKPGTDTIDKRGQKLLDEFMDNLEAFYGGIKVQTSRIFTAILMRGAFVMELVLDKKGRKPIDLVVPDPAQFRFRRQWSAERGEYWQIGQWQMNEFVVLDMPTVTYIPLDPDPDSPYGTPLIGSAAFPTIFLIGLLHDLRRVVAQQGYPRTDIVVDLEKMRLMYPDMEDEDFETKVNDIIAQLRAMYSSLQPDDAFIHTDATIVDRASGAVEADVVGGAVGVIEALERMAMKSLKTNPLMMGDMQGASEATSNRQWEIFAEGVTSLQHMIETALSRMLQISLQVQGIQSEVKFRFHEVRSADELRDEQIMQTKIVNALQMEEAGYIDADEAAQYCIGHEARGVRMEKEEPTEPLGVPDQNPGGLRQVIRAIGDVSDINPAMISRAKKAWQAAFDDSAFEYLLDAEPVTA